MKQQSALNKLSNLFEKTGVTDANVIITKPNHKFKPKLEFGMIFPEVINAFMQRYTYAEMKTLMMMCECSQWQNAVNITQQFIANRLGVSKQAVSPHYKKFFKDGVLIKDDTGSVWVNPALFVKGSFFDVLENKTIYKQVEPLANDLGLEEPPF